MDHPAIAFETDCFSRPRDWAVASTRSRAEKAFAQHLHSNGISVYLPLLPRRRVYGNIVRKSLIPLFPGYVFFDINKVPQEVLYATKFLSQILRPSDPVELHNELQQIATCLNSENRIRETCFGTCGTKVQVVRGPLKGMHGELVRIGTSNRLIVRITFIGKAIELQIDEAFIERAV